MTLHAQTYRVYPVPQKVTMNGNTIKMTPNVNIVKETGINEITINRVQEVLTDAGFSFTVSNTLTDDQTNILIGINGSKEIADNYATSHSLSRDVFAAANNKYDPHLLQINNHHAQGDIIILGDHTGSAYYGMATLEQILEQTAGNNLQTATFEDYSHTQYRGIVEGFYGHPYSTESRLNLLDYCKRYKMNMFVRLPDNHNRPRTPHGADHPRRPARTGKQSESLQCCFYMVDPSGTRRRRYKLQQSGSGSGSYHGEIRSPAQIGYTAFRCIHRRYERSPVQPV